MVDGSPGKIDFCTSELDLRGGSKFLGRDLDPPTSDNSLTSKSLLQYQTIDILPKATMFEEKTPCHYSNTRARSVIAISSF